MNPLILDTETTTFQKGHPFSEINKLCYVGSRTSGKSHLYPIEYSPVAAYGDNLRSIAAAVSSASLFVAFSAKFDIHWLRRYGIQWSAHLRLWDLQLAEFIISNQRTLFPDLNSCCISRGLPGKLDIVKTEYWDKGIDTTGVPEPTLRAYLEQDLRSEENLFWAQVEYLKDKPALKRLIWHACQDLLVTAEMEWNGIAFDMEKSLRIGDDKLRQANDLNNELDGIFGSPIGSGPPFRINWGSGPQLSAVLYGGVIKVDGKEEYEFVYKDGRRKTKTRNVERSIQLPRLLAPLRGSELKEKGRYKTDEGTLASLRATGRAKEIIKLVLQQKKLDKAVGTYFHGFPKRYKEMQWTNNILHGQLNHCTAVTGRLASSKPNLQNMDPGLLECIMTRFSTTKNKNTISK